MPDRKPHKFIGFFKLIEAMQQPGCPVCRRIGDQTHHAMESFLYESVNDPGLRKIIRADGGLCRRHSWQLAGFGDALGGAILFKDVLESVWPTLGASALSKPHGRGLKDKERRGCLFCRGERESLDGVFMDMIAHLEDAELRAAWDGPALLCMPHLSELCGRIGDVRRCEALVKRHRERYAELCRQMEELIAKQSYEHHPGEIGVEKNSWLRGIEALVGRSGTF